MNQNKTPTKKTQSTSTYDQGDMSRDIELVLAQTRDTITVPSRDQFRPLFDRVTKHEVSRYTLRKGLFMDAWTQRLRMIPKALLISGAVGIATLILMILPVTSSQVTDTPEGVMITEEVDQEMMLLDQENTLIDSMIDDYFQQLNTLGEHYSS